MKHLYFLQIALTIMLFTSINTQAQSSLTGTITGNVSLEVSGTPVPNALIQFVGADWKINTSFFTRTDINGNYKADIPSGNYYVICFFYKPDSIHLYELFYDEVHSFAKAKIVTVFESEIVGGINFRIPESFTAKHSITFKGKVTTESNEPLANAKIKIWSVLKWHRAPAFIETRTDAEGYYTVKLDNLHNSINGFIAGAFKSGYKSEFYLNKEKFYEADILLALSDTIFSDVDFALIKKDTIQKFAISGKITSKDSVAVHNCFIIAQSTTSHRMGFAVSDENGNYKVDGLAAGEYHLMFVAAGYVPEFYNNAFSWENALTINLTASLTGIDVELDNITTPNVGIGGSITGTVKSEAGIALAGTVVTLKTTAGITIGYSVTDNSGLFTISGMTAGEYKVMLTKYPYKTKEELVTYNMNDGDTQVMEYKLSGSTTATGSDNEIVVPGEYSLDNNFPNPFNPSTTIRFAVPQKGLVKLTIFNLIGEKISEPVNQIMDAGYHSVKFNANGISSGIYFYRLESNNYIEVKKMILQK